MKAAWWVFVGIVLVLSYVRIYFGVDITDESYYVALAHRFALGDKPFVDEWNMTQGGALLTTPLVWLYSHLRGGTDGVLLFTRHLYFAATCGVAYVIYRVLSGQLDRLAAALAALIYVCFIPFGLPNLSYNTELCAAFTLGILVAFDGRRNGRLLPTSLAGLCHGVGALAYPPSLVVVAAFGIWHARTSKGRRLVHLLMYAGSAGAVIVLVLAAYRVTPADLLLCVRRLHDSGDEHGLYGWRKLGSILILLVSHLLKRGFLAMLAATLAACAVGKRSPWLGLAFLTLGLVVLAWRSQRGGLGHHGFLLSYAMLAPVIAFRLRKQFDVSPWLWEIWIPSLVPAMVMAWTSKNGILNGAIGFTPGAIATSVLLSYWLRDTCNESSAPGAPWLVASLPRYAPTALVLLFLLHAGRITYGDGKAEKLRAMMGPGPFHGLITAAAKKADLEQMYYDIETLSPGGGTILVFPYSSAGYLVSSRRPATPSVWDACLSIGDARCAEYYRQLKPKELLVLRLSGGAKHPLDEWVRETCQEKLTRTAYSLFDQCRE